MSSSLPSCQATHQKDSEEGHHPGEPSPPSQQRVECHTSSSKGSGGVWLRILHINDVYELHQLPHFKTLVDAHHTSRHPVPPTTTTATSEVDPSKPREEPQGRTSSDVPDRVVVILAGDFLAPSLLSSLDQGTAMVDCLRAAGVTHVCLGNHEADVPTVTALPQRILQSQHQSHHGNRTAQPWVWLNSNMPELDGKWSHQFPHAKTTVPYDIITVQGKSRSGSSSDLSQQHQRNVALLGLLTEDPALYCPSAFAGATIEPVIATTEQLVSTLLLTTKQNSTYDHPTDDTAPSVDLILPITHQSMKHDVQMAEHFLSHASSRAPHPPSADDDNHRRNTALFPILIGGHDHVPYNEIVTPPNHNNNNNNHNAWTRIVKVGMDATHTGITDIEWDESTTTTPRITFQCIPTKSFPPDPAMIRRVHQHGHLVRQLEQARLFRLDHWFKDGDDDEDVVFSTKDNRQGPSTGTTVLASILRMGMRCECALLNAGSVRGNRSYTTTTTTKEEEASHFTYKDLLTELPFPTEMTVACLPGKVLQDTLTHSHQVLLGSGGYLHTCSNIGYNQDTNTIDWIVTSSDDDQHHNQNGTSNNTNKKKKKKKKKSFDPNRSYWVTFPANFLQGMDNHEPLLKWAASLQQQNEPAAHPMSGNQHPQLLDHEAARPARLVIVQVFSALIWLQLGSFDDLDVNQDGRITRSEVQARLQHVLAAPDDNTDNNSNGNDNNDDDDTNHCQSEVVDLVVDNIMSVADRDGNGCISPLELMVVHYVAQDLIHHVNTQAEWDILRQTASRILQLPPEDDRVTEMMYKVHKRLDTTGDGKIRRSEAIQALGPVCDEPATTSSSFTLTTDAASPATKRPC